LYSKFSKKNKADRKRSDEKKNKADRKRSDEASLNWHGEGEGVRFFG